MEHNTLSFYQAQYQPSYLADQQKIDDWLTSGDSLNTPDINPEFFIEANLFNTKINKIDSKPKDLIDDFSFINNDLTLSGNSLSANDRSATYSPTYSDKQLESSAININSPEMMPVSPNKVCPQMDSTYGFDDEINNYNLVEYDNIARFDYTSPSASTCNSRSSSISAGSDNQNFMNEYLLASGNDLLAPTSDSLYRVPHSPASSQYSTESSHKEFITLDSVNPSRASLQQIVVKQEPLDQYQPTVIAEYESGINNFTQLSQPQSVSSYSTLNAADIAASTQYYQYQGVSSLPSTVTAAIMQQPQQTSSGQTSPTGRKRNANSAFSTSGSSSSTGSTKKPRMTKREKQKMMESDISKYENENKDLRQSIDLLERQIQFCKRFLSENVAPVIQRQQQQQQQQQMHQFGGQQMVLVEGM